MSSKTMRAAVLSGAVVWMTTVACQPTVSEEQIAALEDICPDGWVDRWSADQLQDEIDAVEAEAEELSVDVDIADPSERVRQECYDYQDHYNSVQEGLVAAQEQLVAARGGAVVPGPVWEMHELDCRGYCPPAEGCPWEGRYAGDLIVVNLDASGRVVSRKLTVDGWGTNDGNSGLLDCHPDAVALRVYYPVLLAAVLPSDD